MQTNEPKTKCDCFGDSGLHASTYVPRGSDVEHCDLCGLPIADDSVDALTLINSVPADGPQADKS